MVAYTLAALSYLSGKSLDLSRIWDEQHVLSSSVMSELTITVPSVYAKLVNGDEHVSYKVKIETRGDDGKRHKHYETRDIPPEELEKLRATALYRVMLFVKDIEPVIWDVLVAGVKAGENTNSWTKRLGCWDALKATLSEKDLKFPQDVISSAGDSDEEITDGPQRKIEEMRKVPADVWFSINKWAKETLLLTPRETAFIGQMGYRIKRGFGVTYKQAKWAMDLYEKAQTKGWSDDR